MGPAPGMTPALLHTGGLVKCGADGRRPSLSAMAESFDPNPILVEMLTEHGPLHEGDIAQRLRDTGVTDPAGILRRLRLGIDFPAGQLTDGRWVWLPAVLASRVFTRRITQIEADFDLLTIAPDLEAIAVLCRYPSYERLADGSAIHCVTPGDDRLPAHWDVSPGLLGADAAIALAVGTFEALGVGEGDLVALRLSTAGLVVERVDTAVVTTAGARLAELLGEGPQFVGTLVWTACQAAPTLFTEATAPLSELAAGNGLAQRGAWLAPPDTDFARWDFLCECALIAQRHRLGNADAVTVNMLRGCLAG